MPFDATVLAAVVRELDTRLKGARINKIYQPHPRELALLLYASGENHRLLLSCHPQFARMHLTRAEKPNPPQPPVFCMLLRKHLEGGRILAVRQAGRERIARLEVGALDELGNPATYTLVAELMGKHSNLVLLAPGARVVDAARRVTEEANAYREVLPGLPYVPPPATGKLDPAQVTGPDLAARREAGAGAGGQAWQLVLEAVDGLGPLIAREVAHRAGLAHRPAPELSAGELAALASACRDLYAEVDAGRFAPVLLLDEAGAPKDFAALRLAHWRWEQQPGAGMSAVLDRFFTAREAQEQYSLLRAGLARTLAGELARVRRKAALQAQELAESEEAESLRRQGELLMGNLWQVEQGAAAVTVTDWHDPEQGQVTIALDPHLTPAENAQAYFRRYQKARAGRAAIQEQLEKSRAEQAYLEQVEATLAGARSLPELAEIRRELEEEGYLRPAGAGAARPGAGRRGERPGERGGRPAPPPPLTLRSSDGLEIWVGRNNRQNDALTTRLSAPTDLWLHAKEIPGAHVILRLPPGAEPPERSLLEAAALAAWFSRARGSANVPVDYTLRKHVRKPAGARPGMVIYDHQRTVYVTPDPARFPILPEG